MISNVYTINMNVSNKSSNFIITVIVLIAVLETCVATELDNPLTDHASNEFLKVDKRVINGNKGTITDYGYLVAIFTKKRNRISYKCGGAILSDEWIVTAAHCYNSSMSYVIRSGQDYILSVETFDNEVIDIVIHDKYTGHPHHENDIALMRVKKKFIWDEQHRFIKLHKNTGTPRRLEKGIVASYGSTNEDFFNLTMDGYIHVVTLSIRKQKYCEKIYHTDKSKYKHYFGSKTLCAGGVENDILVNLRVGDSGSPLVVDNHLVGIAFWTSRFDLTSPAVFTRVSVYRDWIRNKISEQNQILNCFKVG